MVEQCLARDPELAGGGAPVAVISFERGTEKTTAKISLSLLPGSRNFLFPEGDRKVLRLDDTTGGSHEGDLDGLTKLADVSRPFVLQKDRFRIGAPRARFDSVAIQSLALEELGENVNILPAVTQRRDEDRWCGDSIIEILAKPALTNAAPEIMAGNVAPIRKAGKSSAAMLTTIRTMVRSARWSLLPASEVKS